MRSTWMNSLLVATAAATLVAGVTLASAQGMGGGGGGGQRMHQSQGGGGFSARGGGGGGHAQMQGRSGGGFSQPHARSFGGGGGGGGGALHAQRGVGSQHATRSEHLGSRSRSMQTGALHAQRGRAFAEQRGQRGRALAEQRRMHGQNLKTTSRTGTQTGVTRSHRGTQAFAQAGTRSRISLTSQQRARIHNVVLHRDFSRFRVTNVNFDIRIGVFVPRSFRLFVIPEDIVFIVPRFRHFRFFVFDDELVIVDPFTFEIVAIIPV